MKNFRGRTLLSLARAANLERSPRTARDTRCTRRFHSPGIFLGQGVQAFSRICDQLRSELSGRA